ncbi:hypothetical protein [Nocardia sp. NPDC050406]|uniref:hypothetical protein n=1 Tax=Nocardia sp. NPDC050406 TaxID=3364318 RepID=UPI003787D5EB
MSYEYVVLLAGAVAAPGDVPAYVRAQQGNPISEDMRFVVHALQLWNDELPVIHRHAMLRVEAAGNAVRVTPADKFDRRRSRGSAVDSAADVIRRLLETATTGLGYQIYDAQRHTLWSP